jgi:hypothetical protein
VSQQLRVWQAIPTLGPTPKSSFTTIFRSTLTNVGNFCGPSIHAIWWQLGKGVDSKLVPLVNTTYPGVSCKFDASNRSPGDADLSLYVLLLTPRLRTAHRRPTLTTPDASRFTSFRVGLRSELLLG